MIRKFNYTGRKKLKRQRINIKVQDDKPIKTFNAVLNLKGLRLSDDAKIYIEPYYKSSFMRFYFGTVANPIVPENTSLSDIPATSVLRFRVKVVDETKKLGKIIRLADKIKPSNLDESGSRKSILHIDWDQDLDQQIFRLSFPENDYPRLEINKRIENAKDLIKSDQMFRSLVFPVAIREVAKKVANTWEDFEEEDGSWQSVWLKFISDVLRVNLEIDLKDKEEDEINYWVEEVVSAFCRQNKFRTKFEQALNKTK